jgi:hypothetical protein
MNILGHETSPLYSFSFLSFPVHANKRYCVYKCNLFLERKSAKSATLVTEARIEKEKTKKSLPTPLITHRFFIFFLIFYFLPLPHFFLLFLDYIFYFIITGHQWHHISSRSRSQAPECFRPRWNYCAFFSGEIFEKNCRRARSFEICR